MTVMKKTEQKDDAVSPVVGVMLMLVVTIIIAAIVAAMSSGLAVSTERAPNAVLKAEVYSEMGGYTYHGVTYPGYGNVCLSSLSGEKINLEKVVVTVYNSSNIDYSFTHPSKATAGQYLESGETINLVYGVGASSSDLKVKPGEYAQVVVIYDDSHILYDEEVVVV